MRKEIASGGGSVIPGVDVVSVKRCSLTAVATYGTTVPYVPLGSMGQARLLSRLTAVTLDHSYVLELCYL